MTEREIQNLIWMRNHQRFKVLLPNYTPLAWWECDLFAVTKAGYFHEFEVKVTVADFRRDARKKNRDSWQWVGNQRQTIAGATKHSQIGRAVGPSRFWYVLPEFLVPQTEIPEWAGFQIICHHGSHRFVRIIKQAPQLHREKIADQIVRHALGVCYYRYWHERTGHARTRAEYDALRLAQNLGPSAVDSPE